MKTTFIDKINDYAPAIGTIVTLETPDVAEMLSLCGFDWLFIDMEHGPLSPGTTQHIIQAVADDCSSIVRVPESSEAWVKKRSIQVVTVLLCHRSKAQKRLA